MPSAAPAGNPAVNSNNVMTRIAHQAAAAADASIPIVVLIARLAAVTTLAAIPLVMHQAMEIHRFLGSLGESTERPHLSARLGARSHT
jgi:hypothetical protein